MSDFITRCPHCQTAFRTNLAQLLAANGNVRCGACLNVFRAEENFLNSEECEFIEKSTGEFDDPDPVTSAAGADALAQDLAEEDPAAEDLDEDVAVEDVAEVDEFDLEIHEAEPTQTVHEPAWHLVEELEPDSKLEDIESEPHPEPESALAQEETFATYGQAAVAEEDLLDDETLFDETLFDETLFDGPPFKRTLFDDTFGERPEPKLFAERKPMVAADLQDEDAPEAFNASNLVALHDVSAPVVLDTRQRNAQSLAGLFFSTLLCLLLAATLFLQVLWQQRETLGQSSQWRPVIALMCNWLPCQVPAQRDLAAISSDNLLVRTHPEQRGALQVSLSFTNQADFAQPFPLLTLRFTDQEHNIVAMRRFLPEQYLQDELRSMALLPPNAVVQVRLEIVDPGLIAVNYEVLLEFAD